MTARQQRQVLADRITSALEIAFAHTENDSELRNALRNNLRNDNSNNEIVAQLDYLKDLLEKVAT